MAGGDIPLWDWVPGREALPLAGRFDMEIAGDDGLWFVAGTSSRLELDLPAATVSIANRIELQLDSPISADFLAAKAFWSDPQGLPAQLAACKARCERLATVRAALGDDESAWPRYARIVRLAKRIPGILAVIDWLAAIRRRGGRRV